MRPVERDDGDEDEIDDEEEEAGARRRVLRTTARRETNCTFTSTPDLKDASPLRLAIPANSFLMP